MPPGAPHMPPGGPHREEGDVRIVARRFALAEGEITGVPFRAGHIHESFLVTCAAPGGPRRYLVQRVNDHVFRRPLEVIENVRRITEHRRARLAARGFSDVARRVPRLIPAREGGGHHVLAFGGTWRAFSFVEGTRVRLTARTPAEAERTARAFAEYLRDLADLPGEPLHETIPRFHETPHRLAELDRIVREDPAGRIGEVGEELRAIEKHREDAFRLEGPRRRGLLPSRVVHNDTKISNVLFDAATEEALGVVDLDTTMTGLVGHDFGDMMRSMVGEGAEDETPATRNGIRPAFLEALARGYGRGAGDLLTAGEREHLVPAGLEITFEMAVRFLADHLDGDRYFRIERPGQNLDRARAQLRLLEAMHREEVTMREIVARGFAEGAACA